MYFFLTQTFMPSALAVSLTPGGAEVSYNAECSIRLVKFLTTEQTDYNT